jgi:hypothetical protein
LKKVSVITQSDNYIYAGTTNGTILKIFRKDDSIYKLENEIIIQRMKNQSKCKPNDKIIDLLVDTCSLFVSTLNCVYQINFNNLIKHEIEPPIDPINNDLVNLFNDWNTKNNLFKTELDQFNRNFNSSQCF